MRYLYHATSKTNGDSILKEGLKPFGNKTGNWFTNISSNQKLVYLFRGNTNLNNTLNAHHFATRACIISDCDEGMTLEIDIDGLSSELLRVDENFIDKKTRGKIDNCPLDLRREQRNKAETDNRWRLSIEEVSLCAYAGTIEPRWISRTDTFKITDSHYYRYWMFDRRFSIEERSLMHDYWLSVLPPIDPDLKNLAAFDINPHLALMRQRETWQSIGLGT